MKKIKNVDFLLFLVQISDISEILDIILVNHRYKEKKMKATFIYEGKQLKKCECYFYD